MVQLAARIARLADQLRGTRLYWQAWHYELMGMIKDLKCPHVFVTASAADMHWIDLHGHGLMPRTAPPNSTEQERI